MKHISANAIAATFLIIASGAMAAEMPGSAKKNRCSGCHAVNHPKLGPSWQAIANKYKGDDNAAEKLAAKITEGSKGAWGKTPMLGNTTISDDDKNEIVNFILGLAK